MQLSNLHLITVFLCQLGSPALKVNLKTGLATSRQTRVLLRAVPEIVPGEGSNTFSLFRGWGTFALKFVLWVMGEEQKSVLGMEESTGNPRPY